MTHNLSIARIDYLFEQLRTALINAVFVMLVATAVFWQQTDAPFFFLWFAFALSVGAARYLLYRSYVATPTKQNYRPWLLVYRQLAALHGLLWSVLAVAALHYGGVPALSLALIMLAGITAGSVATSAADLPTFIAYSFATLVPISAYLLFSPTATEVWLGVLCGGFLLGMLQLARNYNHTFCRVLRISFENADLLQTLHQEKQSLALAKEQAERLADQLYELSSRDGLTGLSNRRTFDEALARHVSAQNRALSLILCDIDAFKGYNDRYGHPQGDLCLKCVAAALQGIVTRPGDVVARYGGEEFGIILSDTDGEGALAVALKLREAVRGLALNHEASPVAQVVTVSFGLASLAPGHAMNATDLLERADKALYRAKTEGRDRVVVGVATSRELVA